MNLMAAESSRWSYIKCITPLKKESVYLLTSVRIGGDCINFHIYDLFSDFELNLEESGLWKGISYNSPCKLRNVKIWDGEGCLELEGLLISEKTLSHIRGKLFL
jgi:hypothetical protein